MLLVEAEQQALRGGASRKQAIMAAYDRFYRGDIAQELVRGTQEEGGLITMEDLAAGGAHRGAREHQLQGHRCLQAHVWTQGPALLQALNILEDMDLKAMGYNSARYIHALYQAMNLAFADRDFYYGDPLSAPRSPSGPALEGVRAAPRRRHQPRPERRRRARPGDPYPFQRGTNPFREYLDAWRTTGSWGASAERAPRHSPMDEAFRPAPPPSRPPTPRAGWSRSHRAAAGSPPSSPAARASASASGCRASCWTRPRIRSTSCSPGSSRASRSLRASP
jgi:gamma-glutamyltranspeptidase / glutathione hydrolase